MNSPTYYIAKPNQYGGLVFGVEKVTDAEEEFLALWQQHWDETEVLYLDDRMNPDTQAMRVYEAVGALVIITARDAETGQLVGDAAYFIGPNLHVLGTTIAKEDAFFMLSEYRNGRNAVKLLAYAEYILSEKLRIDYVGMSDKSPVGGKSLAKFMQRRGYSPVATYYLKKLR